MSDPLKAKKEIVQKATLDFVEKATSEAELDHLVLCLQQALNASTVMASRAPGSGASTTVTGHGLSGDSKTNAVGVGAVHAAASLITSSSEQKAASGAVGGQSPSDVAQATLGAAGTTVTGSSPEAKAEDKKEVAPIMSSPGADGKNESVTALAMDANLASQAATGVVGGQGPSDAARAGDVSFEPPSPLGATPSLVAVQAADKFNAPPQRVAVGVLVAGAGPVGLLHALALKRANAGLSILVVESRDEKSAVRRDQHIILSEDILNIIRELQPNTQTLEAKYCMDDKTTVGTIAELQEYLLTWCAFAKIIVQYDAKLVDWDLQDDGVKRCQLHNSRQEVTEVDASDIIIACGYGGAAHLLSKKMLDCLRQPYHLQDLESYAAKPNAPCVAFACTVKVDCDPKAFNKPPKCITYCGCANLPHLRNDNPQGKDVFAYIAGHEANYTVAIMVSANSPSHDTFKTLNDDQVAELVRHLVQQEVKLDLPEEAIRRTSLGVFKVAVGGLERSIAIHRDRFVVLVGDAAAQANFFTGRGLNSAVEAIEPVTKLILTRAPCHLKRVAELHSNRVKHLKATAIGKGFCIELARNAQA